MLELLSAFSLTEVVTFLVLLAGAIKGFVSFWDWAVARLRQAFKKESQREDNTAEIKKLKDKVHEIDDVLKKLSENVELLMQSDRDDIKAWITEKHHYYCYTQGWIDDYSIDCIEKRYEHYKTEGGNSFVLDLMQDLRKLPKVSGLKGIEEKGDKK